MAVSHGKASHGKGGVSKTKGHRMGGHGMHDSKEAKTSKKHARKVKSLKGGRVPS